MTRAMSASAVVGGVAFGRVDGGVTRAGEGDPARTDRAATRALRQPSDGNPGPPRNARIELQYYVEGGLLAIPLDRRRGCVPPDFDLPQIGRTPGPETPGTSACPPGRGSLEWSERVGTHPGPGEGSP